MAQSLQQQKSKLKRTTKKRLSIDTYPKELTIVAEGDSWFDYTFKKDILDHLVEKGYAIKKLAEAGDTLDNMVYGSKCKKKGHIVKHLGPISLQKTLNEVRKNKPQFVLFSAGGNDIVGSEIIGYLNHKLSKPASLINKAIFDAKLNEMRRTIEFFIKSVNKTSKKTHVLMDGYDYAKVNGKGYSFIIKNIKGPWLLPSMGAKAIVNKSDQVAIIKYLVDEFNEMLAGLSDQYPFFHHIDLRGMFPSEKEWDNEIHLKSNGFKKVAQEYHNKMTSILAKNPITHFHADIIASL